jgi:hypothetical protein
MSGGSELTPRHLANVQHFFLYSATDFSLRLAVPQSRTIALKVFTTAISG